MTKATIKTYLISLVAIYLACFFVFTIQYYILLLFVMGLLLILGILLNYRNTRKTKEKNKINTIIPKKISIATLLMPVIFIILSATFMPISIIQKKEIYYIGSDEEKALLVKTIEAFNFSENLEVLTTNTHEKVATRFPNVYSGQNFQNHLRIIEEKRGFLPIKPFYWKIEQDLNITIERLNIATISNDSFECIIESDNRTLRMSYNVVWINQSIIHDLDSPYVLANIWLVNLKYYFGESFIWNNGTLTTLLICIDSNLNIILSFGRVSTST